MDGTEWRKSSRSSGNGGACVEIAEVAPRLIAVRDSKDPDGARVTMTRRAWATLLVQIRDGDHHL